MSAHTPLDGLLRGKVGAWLGTVAAIAVISAGSVPFVGAAAAQEATVEPTATAEATPEPTSDPSSAETPAPSPEPTETATGEPTVPASPAAPTDPYLVTFASGTSSAEQTSALADAGATEVSSVPQLRLRVVTVPQDDASALDALRDDARVSRVEGDAVREAESTPNDPRYAEQWALPMIGWDTAYTAGAAPGSATIAVLDTGVDGSDADLAGQLVPGTSTLDDGDGLTDPNGHGTAMASIAAAATDNGTGIAGVGFSGVKVMPVTVLDAEGLGQDSDIVEGVVWAADRGADVILMSFSNPGYSFALQAAVDYAWSKGAVLVAATGNDSSTTVTYPAGTAKVMGIAATTTEDTLWGGSNAGPAVFLAAPGVEIASGSGTTTGTSASAAIVAGAAAQLASSDSAASNAVIVGRLARNADAVEGAGNGRVNLARSLGDTSTAAVVPAGQVNGATGPFVGPYVAAALGLNATYSSSNTTITTSATGANAQKTYQFAYTPPNGGSTTYSSCTTGSSSPSHALNLAQVYGASFPTGVWTVAVSEYNASNAADCQLNGAGTGKRADSAALPLCVGAGNVICGRSYRDTDADGVLDNGEPPLAGVEIRLFRDTSAPLGSFDAGDAQVGASVTTLSNGDWGFANLSNSTYFVRRSANPSGTVSSGAQTGSNSTGTTTSVVSADLLKVIFTATTGASSTNNNFLSKTAPVNGAPTANAQSVTAAEDTAKGVTLAGSDPEGSPLTYAVVSGPANGVLTGTAPTLTYTPNANFNGTDSFTYTANDGTLDSNVATVTITVTAVNDAPVAVDDAASGAEDTAIGGSVLGNDTDVDTGATLTAVKISNPMNGTVTLGASGTFTYTPTANFSGTDSFTYKANDGTAVSNVATVSITVTAVNDAPVLAAVGDKEIGEQSTLAFTATATDADLPANTLTFSLTDAPTGASIAADGSFSWIPTEAQGPGSYDLTVVVSDGELSDSEQITIEVLEVNTAPVLAAVGDKEIGEQSTLAFTATATDADLPANTLTFSLTDAPTGASIAADGSFSWIPTEAQGPGSYDLTVVVSDGELSDSEQITIEVLEVNTAPVLAAVGDKEIGEQSTLAFTATATDADLPANTLTFSLTDAPTGASIAADGSFSWIPTEAQGPGSYDLTVVVSDGELSDSEQITIEVLEVNTAPVLAAVGDKEIGEQSTLAFTATATDADLPANTLTFSLTDAPTGASIAADGSFSWIPTEAQGPGSYDLTVVVSDGELSDSEQITIEVLEVNTAPAGTDGTVTALEDEAYSFTAEDFGFSDPNDTPANSLAAVTITTLPANGELKLGTAAVTLGQSIPVASLGTLTFIPAADGDGDGYASFTFQLQDDGGIDNGGVDLDQSANTLTIDVTSVNDAPEASANPTSQTVQYSDPIAPVTVTSVKDIDSDASLISASILSWRSGGTARQLPALGGTGLTLTPVDTGSFPLVWQLAGRAMVGAGTYTVTVRVTDGTTPTDLDVTIVVTKENAFIEYTGDSFRTTASPTANSATVTLSAVIREAGAVGALVMGDTSIGDQLGATSLMFSVLNYGGGEVARCVPVVVLTVTNPGIGTASCAVSVPASDNPYSVKVVLVPNGFYEAGEEEAALTVSLPGTGATTGGGWVTEPNFGTKSNFGFTAKRLKNGSIQGNSLYIYRKSADLGNGLGVRDYNFRVKSNSWQGGGLSLSANCNTTVSPFTNCTAVFSGKANITAIDRSTGKEYSLGGGYTYRVDVTDKGEPGAKASPTPDTYGIKVSSGTGTYYQLHSGTAPNSSTFPQLNLGGGNIQVRP